MVWQLPWDWEIHSKMHWQLGEMYCEAIYSSLMVVHFD